jgi:hypothetical protein
MSKSIAGIGLIGDADGFGQGKDLRIDYFLPGTPEEGVYEVRMRSRLCVFTFPDDICKQDSE